MDIQAAKLTAKQADIQAIIGTDTTLRKVASTRGGEYAGKCPFCGGVDRFRVQPAQNLWTCRQCQHDYHWKDPVDYVRRRDGLGFMDALAKVAGEVVQVAGDAFSFGRVVGLGATAPSEQVEPPSPDWQAKHYAIISECEDRLFSDAGRLTLNYLTSRGLLSWNIAEACMGVTSDGKILIPNLVAGVLWGIKYRKLDKKEYGLFSGSRLGAPYLKDWWTGKRVLVVVEGELDALLAYRCVGGLADVTTLGSATAPLGSQFIPQIKEYGLVLVATDADDAGDKCAEYWQSINPQAYKRLRPVGGKDITDMWANGGDVREWIIREGFCE